MAYVLADRVFETTTTTGTGTINLAGTKTGFQSFVQGVGDGEEVPYLIDDGIDWEVGLGTVTAGSPDTLSRDTIYQSTNSDAAVNWGAGTRNVRLSLPANLYATQQDIIDFIASATDGTITALDEVVYRDISDSGNTKKDTVQGIIDLVPEFNPSALPTVTIADDDFIVGIDTSDSDESVKFLAKNVSGLQSIGVGQTYQNVTSTRAKNTTYTNSTAKPIEILINGVGQVATQCGLEVSINSGTAFIFFNSSSTTSGSHATGTFIVPAGETYRVNNHAGLFGITTWMELR